MFCWVIKMNICVKTSSLTNIPKDKTLRDVLGHELDSYYDGWEYGKVQKWYFIDVPSELINVISFRAKSLGLDVNIY